MNYKTDSRLQQLINKQVNFQFHGIKLRFDLSMGLFSSFDIDTGSRLLLKTLAKETPLESYGTALDTGCGTGILGICLKKKFPLLSVRFQDRDALATEFTRHNAILNGIKLDDGDVTTGLLLDEVKPHSLDLIVCNIPAKAGDHVIRDFIFKAAGSIKADGCVAVVIVDTLKEVVRSAINDCGSPLIYTEGTKMHSVFHFGSVIEAKDLDFNRYIRRTGDFKLCDDRYKLSTVYNLPDFDQHSFWLHVSGELLRHSSFSGRALFWNPGQGHLPIWLNSRKSNHFKSITLVSNDILQNKISHLNLQNSEFSGEIETMLVANELFLEDSLEESSFDCIFMNLNPIPKVKWHKFLAETVLKIVKPSKYCFLMARSSDLSLLEKHIRGFKIIEDDRFKGNRGLLLRKN